VLEMVLDGQLRATPVETDEGKRWAIEGSAGIVKMLGQDAGGLRLNVASPAGFGTLRPPEIPADLAVAPLPRLVA
jgi:hypothetical protein